MVILNVFTNLEGNILATSSNTVVQNTLPTDDKCLDIVIHVESPNKSRLSEPIIDTNRDPCQGKENAYNLLMNGFGPYQPMNYDFPKRGGSKFRSEWFNSFPWLEYSPSKDSAYCFHWHAFPSNKSYLTFISEGFRQWSKACFKSFPKHEQSVSHKESSMKIAGYNEAKQSGSIISKVSTQYNQEVADNKEYLKYVFETLLFCARQGISIRGHRENEESLNKGNFQELLNLRSRDNNIIKRYYTDKEKIFRYVSGAVYLPPMSTLPDFEAHTSSIEHLISSTNPSSILLCGDYNLPLIKWSKSNQGLFASGTMSNTSTHLVDSFSYYNFYQLNQVPNARGCLLDLVFSSFVTPTVQLANTPIVSPDSYHPPLFVSFPFPTPITAQDTHEYRDYKSADYKSMLRYLGSFDWENTFRFIQLMILLLSLTMQF
ncbi:hypothetical protein ACI65C_004806 [Semiaphis heraclei]